MLERVDEVCTLRCGVDEADFGILWAHCRDVDSSVSLLELRTITSPGTVEHLVDL